MAMVLLETFHYPYDSLFLICCSTRLLIAWNVWIMPGHLVFRGISVSHETVRSWNIKFSHHFRDVIKKRERKSSDKWHLDETTVKINGKYFILWRAVDSDGYELDILLQKHRNKKAAIRFLSFLCNLI